MMLPQSIQVCPVEIPGRGRREGEESIDNVAELASALAYALPLQASPQLLCTHEPDSTNVEHRG